MYIVHPVNFSTTNLTLKKFKKKPTIVLIELHGITIFRRVIKINIKIITTTLNISITLT